jgi:NADH:ubiquinone oxidoreductase subunit E
MANIREHVSWVTRDQAEATRKARALIAAAVRRIALAAPLERRTVPVFTEAMVVGGGIAGIHAALVIAESGKTVYLVEREPTIGGHMAMFDKTFPTLDCAACILTPKMSNVKADPDIVLMTNSEVVSVEGYVGNFKVKVKRKARYVDEDTCTGCGECIAHCVVRNKVDIPPPRKEPPLEESTRQWVETTLASLNGHSRSSLIAVLLEINEQFHYLPRPMLDYVAWRLDVPQSEIYAIATFYKGFSLEPRGKSVIKVCTGTACHVRGADRNIDEIKRCINLEPGQTSPDLKYTLEVVNCVGACAMAPVVIVNKKYHRNAGTETIHGILGLAAAVAAESDEGGDE